MLTLHDFQCDRPAIAFWPSIQVPDPAMIRIDGHEPSDHLIIDILGNPSPRVDGEAVGRLLMMEATDDLTPTSRCSVDSCAKL